MATHLLAAPPNDDYENRTVLTGRSVIFSGTLVGATVQQGELLADYVAGLQYSNSVWWTWTSPVSGYVTVRLVDYTDPRVRDGYLAVWHNVDWPNRTGTNDCGTLFFVPGQRYATFFATAGVAYDLQMEGDGYGTFTLQLAETNAPIITQQPASQSISVGESMFLGVSAGGLGPFTYQWQFNGSNLPQETGAILLLDNFDTNMAGTYSVIVSNSITAVQSEPAVVTVTDGDMEPVLSIGSLIPDWQPSPSSGANFTVSGEPGRSYILQSSTNLTSWNEEAAFWLGPEYPQFASIIPPGTKVLTITSPDPAKFYRAERYFPNVTPTAPVCINHLKAIRFAKEIWGSQRNSFEQWGVTPIDTPASSDLVPLFRTPPSCPLDDQSNIDSSYILDSVNNYPECKISSPTHILQEAP